MRLKREHNFIAPPSGVFSLLFSSFFRSTFRAHFEYIFESVSRLFCFLCYFFSRGFHSASSASLSLCFIRFVYFRLSGSTWDMFMCVVSPNPNPNPNSNLYPKRPIQWTVATVMLLCPPVFNCILRSNRICALFSVVDFIYTLVRLSFTLFSFLSFLFFAFVFVINEISVVHFLFLFASTFGRILMSV